MPTFGNIGPYKFFFYSAEGHEEPHVHIRRDRATAKFWLETVQLAKSRHFGDHELGVIQRLVEENKDQILEVWHEHFDH